MEYKIFYIYFTSLSAWLHWVVALVVIDKMHIEYRSINATDSPAEGNFKQIH